MTIPIEGILKVLLAILAGGAIGLERELHHKAAGFRTITLICMGASLFTILSYLVDNTGRIASTIVTGIGFLGAGVIMHENNRVTGLTTAATIWLSAAIGMGFGAGAYLLSIAATVIALIVMRLFLLLEISVDSMWEVRQYQITIPCDLKKLETIQTHLNYTGLKGTVSPRSKRQGQMVCIFNASGSIKKHNQFLEAIWRDPEVLEIEW